jgi:hypothetical protein
MANKNLLLNPASLYAGFGDGTATSLFISSANGPTLLSGGSSTGATVLTIYKGTVPDAATFINRTTRDGDILINFPLMAYNATSPALGSGYRLPYTTNSSTSIKLLVGISQTTAVATQSGTATWFWLGTPTSFTDMTNSVFIVGTVGKTTDVADLEIPDNNIESGKEYKSIGCYLSLPFKFQI